MKHKNRRIFGKSGGVITAAALALSAVITVTPAATADPDSTSDELLPLTQYVNTLIGTSTPASSGYAGNVAPGAQVPFGMVNFGPDMPRSNYNGSGGSLVSVGASQATINFFSLTHLNGPGCPGGGVVGMMPASTPTSVSQTNGAPIGVKYQTATESAQPGQYSVQLDNNVKVALTSTNRTGMAQFTYPDQDSGYFSLDTRLNANSNMSSTRGKIPASNVDLSVSEDGKVFSGKTVAPAFCTPWGTNFNSNVYFYAEFDKSLRAQETGSTVNTVNNGAGLFQYDLTSDDPTLNVKVGISSVSVANAKLNLATENANSTFDEVKAASEKEWNERLNSVQIDMAADPDSLTSAQRGQLTEFYTALYRVFVSPTTYSDVNGDYRTIRATKPFDLPLDVTGTVQARATENVANDSFTSVDGTVITPTTHYSGLSMWDTYRSASQALTLFAPDVSSEVMQSLVADGQQCGAFPHWVDNSDDSVPMAGDNALAVLAASYNFGAQDFDITEAARLVKQSVFDPTSNCNGKYSSPNLEKYLNYGYVDGTMAGQPSSATIENNAADHAAAVFLTSIPQEVLDNPAVNITAQDIAKLNDRSTWWKNIFNYDTNKIGGRGTPTEPGELGPINNGVFHESTEPNYFWSFGYAWPDLVDTIGEEAAIQRLNTLFSLDNELTNIPTIKQLNGGQDSQTLYIGNEPAFTAPWAYNFAGKPAGTQYIVRQIIETAFTTARDGLPGNDDFGAMAAWYVFATIGIFPSAQAHPGFALSTPQFPAMTVNLGGKTIRIETDGDPVATPFIETMNINGEANDHSYMAMDDLLNNDYIELDYKLSATPTTWATTTAPTEASTSTTILELNGTTQKVDTENPIEATAAILFSDNISQPGTVNFYNDGNLIGDSELGKGGSVTFTIPANTAIGDRQITAEFVPTNQERTGKSTSEPVALTVYGDQIVDKLVLQAVIEVAAGLSNEEGTYTVETWEALQEKLGAAEQVLADEDATQEDVNTAVSEVAEALAGLQVAAPTIDKSVLQAVVDIAAGLSNEEGTYTVETWEALQEKLGAAEQVLAAEDASQEDVNTAVSEVAEALAGLKAAVPVERKVVRHFGSTRYETSLEMLKEAQHGSPVFVATGEDYADVLSAAPAAALQSGAVVLSRPDKVDPKLVSQLTSLSPEKIYIVGGKDALSPAVEKTLKSISGAQVKRLSGDTRYETSLAIYDEFFAGTGFDQAFIATGLDYPDALTASSAAGAVGAPVILVNGKTNTVSSQVTNRLGKDAVTTVLISGGKNVVSERIENSLKPADGQVVRLSGADRYATNEKINAWVDSQFGEEPIKDVYVATGNLYPDALSAAVPAANPGSRLVLSPKDCMPKASAQRIDSYTAVETLHLVGGTAVLADQVGQLKVCR